MSNVVTQTLESLEGRRALAFTFAGVLFAGDLTILLYNFSAGTENQFMDLGQALIGTAWAAGFLGILGGYPALTDRSRWLTRIGGVFSVVGFVAMVFMAVVSFGVFVGLIGGGLDPYVPMFLPGVFLGIVLGFGPIGIATLRSGTAPPAVGVLFLLLVGTFLFNLGTGITGTLPYLAKVIGVLTVLTLTNLALGYLLGPSQTGTAASDASAPDSAT